MPKAINWKSGLICAAASWTCLFTNQSLADPSSLLQTKTELKKLDGRINGLEKQLDRAQDKRVVLDKELERNEKQIGECLRKSRSIEMTMRDKERTIAALQAKSKQLTLSLKKQQDVLANHLRSRYLTGEYQPLKWLLNQDDPLQISRLLTYYQYLIASRKQWIMAIDETRKNLRASEEKLHRELLENKQLRLQLEHQQHELASSKTRHTKLMKALSADIQQKEQTLEEYKRNKRNLSHLLQSLMAQSLVQPQTPFANMRKKLPLPIHTRQRSLRSMHQGVTFFADEGAMVTAVYPGKVVFSDWLKGYGLLMIIDHGQGFMTLYAHNQSLFKPKGSTVLQGEQIASVGHSGGIKENGLYFEIRIKGKAVPPLEWLS